MEILNDSINKYASYLYSGEIIPINKEESAKYYKITASKGDLDGMIKYGQMLYQGDGIDINKEEAIKYLKTAIDTILKIKRKDKNINNANNDDPYSMYIYACALYNGDGIEINKEEAAKFFKMSADKGNVKSMKKYAYMLKHGDGIPVDKKRAYFYFKNAADNYDKYAMNTYAILLHRCNGDKSEVIEHFKDAIQSGCVDAMINCASILDMGIPQIIEPLYKKAAKKK